MISLKKAATVRQTLFSATNNDKQRLKQGVYPNIFVPYKQFDGAIEYKALSGWEI